MFLDPFSPEEALGAFRARLDGDSGAIVTFAGLARAQSKAGAAVATLFETYNVLEEAAWYQWP